MAEIDKEAALRAALFVQCQSKEDLARWIRVYLGVDLPDAIVDPDSNSSPMDLIWELYDAAIQNKEEYGQVLAYAARDSFKTFSSAIFEVLCILHLERSVAHMAAIESQAKKAQQYLKKYVNRPYIRDFVTSKNERTLEVTRYFNETTGENLTIDQYNALVTTEQEKFREIKHYVNVIICTIAGANSEHTPVMVVDEVDVVENADAYEEAKMIPAPMAGKLPMTLYTSTRKYAFGLVQKEIDKAAETQLLIRHWNLMDVTHKCPPTRHMPEKGKLTIYHSDETLRAISEDEWKMLNANEREKYVKGEGYWGCLHGCRLFAACQARLVNRPPCRACGDSGKTCPGFLKPIVHAQTVFKKVTPDKAKAQLLCRKPSTEGLIFPNFSRDVHMLTPSQIAERVTGDKYPDIDKAQLVTLLKERGARFVAGMDHGHTHNFAVVVAAVWGDSAFILDVYAQAELELGQKVELCRERVKAVYDPDVWADTAYPADNKTLKREAGLKIRDWKKGPGSVADGISIVRLRLMPTFGKPEDAKLFMLKSDEGCELLAMRMSQYHWKMDAAGRITDDPDEEHDDEIDAMRYVIMNVFAPKGAKTVASVDQAVKDPVAQTGQKQYMPNTWMQQVISEATGVQPSSEPEPIGTSTGKKGRFNWAL